MKTHRKQEKYFFYSFLFLSLVLAFLVFRPFLIVLIFSVSFALVTHPLYKLFLDKVTKSKAFAAFLTVFIFVFVVGAPLLGIGFMVYDQAVNILNSGSVTGTLIDTITGITSLILPSGFEGHVEEFVNSFVFSVSDNITQIFTSTISTIFSVLLMVMSMFFFLKDGEVWKTYLVKMSPLADSYDRTIFTELKTTINGVIKGYLLIALIQGMLVGIGLFIFGVPNPAFWGVVAGIAAFIPAIGTGLVAIPMIIYLYTQGETVNAMGLIVWSVVIVGLVDNLLHPIIVGRKVNIHPLIILFSVLGGISLLGPAGILIGPLVISLLHTLSGMYLRNFESKSNQ